MNKTFSLNANGLVETLVTGGFQYLRIRKASVPFQLSFDQANWQDTSQNDSFGPMTGNKVFLRAKDGLAASVTVLWGNKPFSAQDVTSSIVNTTALGNGGTGWYLATPVATRAGGTGFYDPADGVACNNIAAGLFFPGVSNGKKRKQIIIQNSTNFADVYVFDSSGGLFMVVSKSTPPIAVETSAAFYVLSYGVAAKVVISETFFEDGQ